ncbi:hypothetical protein [Streptomyces antibioticus]|uniref:hypothetical protein n=1 Tax=Streptomyces antibioticus TaxID=1890 RepID=UPI0033C9FC33
MAMLLRPGNAAANDVADHKTVLAAALRQLPLPLRSKLLIRIDGAAFSHDILDHLTALATSRRRVRWVTGWAIHTTDEEAIARLPEKVWTNALRQDGEVHEITGPDGNRVTYQVAELTGLRDLTGWPAGTRLVVRRVKPSRRDAKKLTAFEKKTGWRYQIVATNIPSHQPAFDVIRLTWRGEVPADLQTLHLRLESPVSLGIEKRAGQRPGRSGRRPDSRPKNGGSKPF